VDVKDAKDERMAYTDLLVATLNQHEKTLSNLIERLERMSSKLMRTGQERTGEGGEIKTFTVRERAPEVITYMQIEVNRPVEELTKILETLVKELRR